MRLSRTSIQSVVAGVAAGTTLMASSASAILTYELRFSGTTDRITVAGSADLELWAVLGGTDLIHTNDTHTFDYITILSTQIDGGAMVGGGLTDGVLAT